MKLKHNQLERIKDWFCPEPGYVLDFSNKTFAEFFEDYFEINILADTFTEYGTSKFNRLRAFISAAPPHLVIEVLNLLWRRRNSDRDDTIDRVERALHGDWGTADVEYLQALQEAALMEDSAFQDLVREIGELPSHAAEPHLRKLTAEWTLDTVERELHRAIENIDKDPEAAVTAACSLVESVCRSIIAARNEALPAKMDIQSLYKPVRDILGLNPKDKTASSEIEADVRMVLSALANAVQGVGALRTHAGSAHGREKGFRRIDPRIARLAVNCASTLALFFVETWERRFPDDKLDIRE